MLVEGGGGTGVDDGSALAEEGVTGEAVTGDAVRGEAATGRASCGLPDEAAR